MTLSHIQELESIDFEWGTAWEDRLSDLADYRNIQGHCNVPFNCNENTRLATWVGHQRTNYKLHLKGKISPMTLSRVQALESMGFEWEVFTAWEGRLGELADYRKIHRHCNVPTNYGKNMKLANWVGTQRQQYRLRSEGKRSRMTLPRIQALESLGFDWQSSTSRVKMAVKKPSREAYARRAHVKVAAKKPNLEDYARRARERAVKAAEHVQIRAQTEEDVRA